MGAPPLNKDVVTEILCHLPLQSLFRFGTACKFWRGVIESSAFKKLHIAKYKHKEDDALLLLHMWRSPRSSLVLLHTGKKKKSSEGAFWETLPGAFVVKLEGAVVSEAVKGLICMASRTKSGVSVYNPSLGEIKSLPLHPKCNLSRSRLHLGIGFDEGSYKVVQLLPCDEHRCLHVSVYSKSTDSWRDLAVGKGQYLDIIEPIKILAQKSGKIAHWRGVRVVEETVTDIIVGFDMKSEVFEILEMPNYGSLDATMDRIIYAKPEAFFLKVGHGMGLTLFQAGRMLGNLNLCWEFVTPDVALDINDLRILRWNQTVAYKIDKIVSFYNYDNEELVGCSHSCTNPKVFEYIGSFVSP